MVSFKKAVSDTDFQTIEKLADTIWREHYTPIIGIKQVEYMLDKYQSFLAMKEQQKTGHEYYIIYNNQQPSGYFDFQKRKDMLFLSKIYVIKTLRGKGLGKAAMNFIIDEAHKASLPKIYLTVNKYNTNSIEAYLKMGFIKTGPVVQDIGEGFIMDDYKMEKEI